MASSRYLITSTTLGSSAASFTFSSIPSTYTNLVLKISARSSLSSSNTDIWMQVNGSSASNYTDTALVGDSSTATSYRETATSQWTIANMPGATATSNTFNNAEIYIPNYALTNKKPLSSFSVTENNSAVAGNSYIYDIAALWGLTSAITSITLSMGASGNFVSGSTFTLYGLKNS